MVTALYAALLALLLFILSIRVIGLRGNPAFAFIAQGRGDDELLQRAIRAHGNFAEYVPLTLLVIFFLESQGAGTFLIHTLCSCNPSRSFTRCGGYVSAIVVAHALSYPGIF